MKFILLICFLQISSQSYAQRAARIIYYQPPKDAPSTAYLHQGENNRNQSIELSRYGFSPAFELEKGDLTLLFTPTAIEEGENPPTNAPQVKIPRNWQNIILFVSENKKNTLMPISVKAFNASDDEFAPGELLFINLSNVHVKGTLGERTLKIGPKSKKNIQAPIQEKGRYRIELDAFDMKTNTKVWLTRTVWKHIPEFKFVVLISEKPAPTYAKLYTAILRDFEIKE